MPGERVAIAGSVIDCDRLLEQPSIEAAAAESWSWKRSQNMQSCSQMRTSLVRLQPIEPWPDLSLTLQAYRWD